MIDSATIKRFLNYDPLIGVFIWRVDRSPQAKAGSEAGTITRYGYRRIVLMREFYFAHTLAWVHEYNETPTTDIDHINRDRLDNRIANLRLASRTQNNLNSDRWAFRGDDLGITPARNGRWYAQITIDAKYVYLGIHDTKEQARAAYLKARAARSQMLGE